MRLVPSIAKNCTLVVHWDRELRLGLLFIFNWWLLTSLENPKLICQIRDIKPSDKMSVKETRNKAYALIYMLCGVPCQIIVFLLLTFFFNCIVYFLTCNSSMSFSFIATSQYKLSSQF